MATRPGGIATVGRSLSRLVRALACMGIATGRLLLVPPQRSSADLGEDDLLE